MVHKSHLARPGQGRDKEGKKRRTAISPTHWTKLAKATKPSSNTSPHSWRSLIPYSKFSRGKLESVARDENRLYKTSPIRDIPLLGAKVAKSDNMAVSLILTPADQSPMMEAYAKARIDWIKFAGEKYFPKDTGWRHTAAEEAAGLRAFSAKVLELNDQKNTDASNWLAAAVIIKKLDEAGLLESAIYLDRPSKDIAQDYPAYREQHRDQLERYLREFWLGQMP